MKTVLVLGGSGMLGSMIVDYLSRHSDFSLTATVRSADLQARMLVANPRVRWEIVDFAAPGSFASFDGQEWIINAIGITKPLIHDDHAAEILTAIQINSLLPATVAREAEARHARVLQIATDCVYSGAKGHYIESDL